MSTSIAFVCIGAVIYTIANITSQAKAFVVAVNVDALSIIVAIISFFFCNITRVIPVSDTGVRYQCQDTGISLLIKRTFIDVNTFIVAQCITIVALTMISITFD